MGLLERIKLDLLLANPYRHRPELRARLLKPDASEVEEIARALIGWRGYFLAHKCRQIAPAIVRRIVAEPIPPRFSDRVGAFDVPALTRNLVFLKEAIHVDCDDETLLGRWRAATQVLADVQSYAEGSAQRRAKLAIIARTPMLLAAVQAAVVVTPPESEACDDFLPVLAVDGSEASADAMMPNVHHAMATGDDLLALEQLRTYAPNAGPVRAMIANVEKLLSDRSASSPPMTLLKKLGIEVTACRFGCYFGSVAKRRSVSIVQASFSFDTRAVPYMGVQVSRGASRTPGTLFNEKKVHSDGLGLGHTELFDVPDFFERAARKLRIRWNWDGLDASTQLRGKNRSAVIAWLSKK